jgi:hypothetical protein
MNTKFTKLYRSIKNMQSYDKKWNQKNMKECDKRKSHISSKLRMISLSLSLYIYISSNNGRHFVTKTFTPLQYTSSNYTSLHNTCRHFTSSHFNFTQIHFTTSHLAELHLNFPFHYTSRHCTFRRFSPNLYSFYFTVYKCFPNSVTKNLGLQLKVLTLLQPQCNYYLSSF